MRKRNILPLTLAATLISCGQSTPHRHHQKQATSSDIKISALDLQKQQIQMRFEYRSYKAREFKAIECQTILSDKESFSLALTPSIIFDSFATEVLSFDKVASVHLKNLNGLKEMSYNLSCKVTYDKGVEYLDKNSVLHLAPNSHFTYR
jgi:hypothetical protein